MPYVQSARLPATCCAQMWFDTTVNTDNMTVSGTTIAREFAALRVMGMTAQEEKQLFANGIKAAFLPETEKEKLREAIHAVY